MTLHQWATRWQVPQPAIADLQAMLGMNGTEPEIERPRVIDSEAAVQNLVRLEASRKGCRVWRNNVGAGYMSDGRFLRWGLANDTEALNKQVKSADLIGIRPVVITPAHVGHTIGQFVSREVKAPDWHFSDTPRERAQLRWAEIICSMGGDAAFASGEGTL
jgi:hypothetical protein